MVLLEVFGAFVFSLPISIIVSLVLSGFIDQNSKQATWVATDLTVGALTLGAEQNLKIILRASVPLGLMTGLIEPLRIDPIGNFHIVSSGQLAILIITSKPSRQD